ncbi:MAG: hypothetical protein JRH11_07605 [Deltaproteobacteria bacterium]|nr:hypothetical protein [Deltaproteobacteria bacterium]
MHQAVAALFLVGSLAVMTACGDDGPPVGPDAGDGGTDGGLCVPESYPPDPGACTADPTDYAPGNGAYDPCVSDQGRYVPIESTISSVGRVRAFEEIAALLFDPTRDPSTADFTDARRIYQEDEGLDSRVVRRYDPHFDVPAGTDCTFAGVPASFPDYCVGPARIQPTTLDALNAGIAGESPRRNAGRVEGALLAFLYVSTFKESLTCTTKAKDCDSSWAYYTGGEPARCGIGLSRYVAEADPYSHDRAWDGALALRCWRDLDDAEVATDLALRDRARTQYDRALLNGVARLVEARIAQADLATDSAEQSYYWGSATTLGAILDREMSARSPTDAAALREELAHESATDADLARAADAIDAVFDCP